MKKDEFIAKLQMVYVGDRNAFNEIIGVYDDLLKENQRLKENNQAMQEEMARTWKKYDEVNNVLNELEKWLNSIVDYETLYKADFMTVRGEWAEEVLDKLKELKESDK